jgi:hypothetical protein
MAEPTPAPTLQPPSPIERSVLSDWVSYSKISHTRLVNASSQYAEFLGDMIGVMDDILNPEGE